MSAPQVRRDTATTDDVLAHLIRCDADFTPPLSTRVDLAEYAAKLVERAARSEAWDDGRLVGLVAAYLSETEGFVSNVSVDAELRGHGVAAALVGDCIERARAAGATTLRLEVATADRAAGRFYAKLGFTGPADGATTTLTLDL